MASSDSSLTGYILLAAAILFTAWGFEHELYFVDVQYSDVAFHLSVLKSLDLAVRGGQNILDFWYDGVPYGFALFRAYQYLPYLVIYGIYRVFGEHFSLAQVLIGSTCVLATLLPASIFFSLRMIGVRALEAGIAAVISILISDGSEYGMGLQNYTFGTVGITTQLWAMVFLAPALAASFQYLHHRKHLALALLFSFLTFGSHVVAAVILMICIGVFVLGILIARRRITMQPLILLGLIVIVTAHQWYFVLLDSPYINRSSLEPSWKYQGRGLGPLLELFWSGGFFDANRLPVLTLLLLVIGLYLIVYNRNIRSEPGGTFLSITPFLFILFFTFCAGRELWGAVFNLVPVLKNLHVHRFAVGVHLFGVIVLGTGLAAFVRRFSNSKAREVLILFSIFLILRPAIIERANMFRANYALHRDTAAFVAQDQDLENLLVSTTQAAYGWTYSGSKTSWQEQLLVAGYVPIDLFTVMRGIPTVGGILYHAFSLAGETLFDFNPNNSSHFNLFGIRNIIAPASWQGSPGFTLVGQFGRYALWSRGSHMMFIADSRFEDITKDPNRSEMARSFTRNFTNTESEVGQIADQSMGQPWHFEATANMKQAGSVIGAVGFHPNWSVNIDGQPTTKRWVMPGLIAADVPAGSHKVSFDYQGSGLKVYLLALSFCCIIGAALVARFYSCPVRS